MTLPHEEARAVASTRLFLIALCNPAITPRVPKVVRQKAQALLKHYPWDRQRIARGPKLMPEDYGF